VSPYKINTIKNTNNSNNSSTKYDFNHINNIHPFNFKMNPIYNKAQTETSQPEKCKKSEEKHQDDKSLIEFLLGKSGDDPSKDGKKEKKKYANKRKKDNKAKKMNIHEKRKNIKFDIVKKDT